MFSTTDTSNADRIISVTVNDGANTSNTAQTFMHVVSVAEFTATDVIDHSQPLDVNFDTQNIDGTATDVTVTATNDVIRTAVSGPGSTTVVPEWALLHDDASSERISEPGENCTALIVVVRAPDLRDERCGNLEH